MLASTLTAHVWACQQRVDLASAMLLRQAGMYVAAPAERRAASRQYNNPSSCMRERKTTLDGEGEPPLHCAAGEMGEKRQ